MKKFIALLLVTITTQTVFAREFNLLKDVHKEFDRLYQVLGNDNNEIASIYFSHTNLKDIEAQIERPLVRLYTLTEVEAYAKKCIFMKNGAYGDHIDINDQEYLTLKLKNRLMSFIVMPEIYLIQNGSSCSRRHRQENRHEPP